MCPADRFQDPAWQPSKGPEGETIECPAAETEK